MSILRKGKLKPQPSDVIEFTSSIKSDIHLIDAVIDINKAHVVMLAKQGIVESKDAAVILKALSKLDSRMPLDPSLEDVHMNVEAVVLKEVGEEVGGNLHVAKSRNDQVSAALRMTLRGYLLKILQALNDLQAALLKVAERHVSAILPGYSHLQQAQPTTVASHFLAYHDAIERVKRRLMGTYGTVNLSPMGACAVAGTSFPIDRQLVANLLGFDGLVESSIDAVSNRDFIIATLADFSLIMNHLSRFSGELILWTTSEFGFVSLPDELVSTSSIMPQKRNPVVLEVIRARAAQVYGNLHATLSTLHGLPSGYSLDFQEVNPLLWDACERVLSSTRAMTKLVSSLEFDEKRIRDALVSFTMATDLANELVKKFKLPFRTAYHVVGSIVNMLQKEGRSLRDLNARTLMTATEKVAGVKLNIRDEDIKRVVNVEASVASKTSRGGTAPTEVERMLKERVKELSVDVSWCRNEEKFLGKAKRKLEEAVRGLIQKT